MISMDANGGVDTGPGLPRGGRPHRPGTRVAALIVACAVVAGGAFAVTEAVSGPGAPAAVGTAAVPAAGPTGQAAVLNDVLAVASGSSTPPGTAAERAALRRLRRALARLRRLGGMYGQFSFETRQGPRTLAFERGTITSVAGAGVAVRAQDGTTWTWVITGASVVREDGARTKATALAVGEQVFAGGLVSGTTRDTRLIVIRKAGTGTA
jgi:hypothetical protein